MQYEGMIYRPWTEANSLLIQTTLGCTHNKCTFCNMFRDKRFTIRALEDIYKDIAEARNLYSNVRAVFLIDGNVMALKTAFLLQIINKITTTFPECEKISLYAGLNDLRRKNVAELKELHQAGLTMGYAGLESGDPLVLERIKKGMTPEQAIEGMAKAKEAGIKMLLSYIFGLGGRERSHEHIVATTNLLNITKPEEMAPMALAIQPGTDLEQEVQAGEFVMPTQLQVLEEERYLLKNLTDFTSFYWGDHGNNLIPQKGQLPAAKEYFLKRVEQAIADKPTSRQAPLKTYAW